MEPTDGDVDAFVNSVTPAKRARDAHRLLPLMRRATGEQPRLWGSIVGFGEYRYRYESGRSGIAPAAGFAPRRQASVIYLSDGIGAHEARLAVLGAHSTGVGCLHLKDLDAVDLEVLEAIVRESYGTLSAGDFGKRAREGGV